MKQFKSERGASLVEYAMVVVLIAVIAVAGVALLGGEASDAFDSVGAGLRGESSDSQTTSTGLSHRHLHRVVSHRDPVAHGQLGVDSWRSVGAPRGGVDTDGARWISPVLLIEIPHPGVG